MTEVEGIEAKLKEKHSASYSGEQFRAWAHLIQMEKHDSYEVPPDKSFWRSQKKKDSRKDDHGTFSPVKRVNLRGQCAEQLLRWHELLQKGAINQEQYNSMQSVIFEEIKKM